MDTIPTGLINLISNYSRSSELVLLLLQTNYWSDLHEDYYRDPTTSALKVLDDSRLVEYFLTAENIKYGNIWTASLLRGYYDNIRLIVKYLDSIKYIFGRVKTEAKDYLTPDPQFECYNILYNTTNYGDLLNREENYHQIYIMSDYIDHERRLIYALAEAIQNDDELFVDYLLKSYDFTKYQDDYLLGIVVLSIFSSEHTLNKYEFILDIINLDLINIADIIMNVKVYIPAKQLISMVEEFNILTWRDIVKYFIDHQVFQYYYEERSPDPRLNSGVYNTFKNHARLQYLQIATNKLRERCENINLYIEFDY